MLHVSHSYFEKNSTAEKRRKEEAFALASIAHYCFVEIKSICDKWAAAASALTLKLIKIRDQEGKCLKMDKFIKFVLLIVEFCKMVVTNVKC